MSSGNSPRIYLSAGEASGDLHAEGVIRALRQRFPDAVIEATGGPCVARTGVTVRHSIERCEAVGLVEILQTVPSHWSLLNDLTGRFRRGSYDLLVLVDYPGFHVRLARAAAAAGVPVLYYIAPQLWAWGPGRAAMLKRWVDELAVILPFEESFFRGLDIPATFVGHPLLDRPQPPAGSAVRERLGIAASAPVLALFPGSRAQEHDRMWPIFRDAASLVRRDHPDVRILVAGMQRFSYAGSHDFTVLHDSPEEVLAAADAALCKSGTSTLEAAIANVPMVVAYRLNPITFGLARRLVRTPHVGLVNLVAGRSIAPELLQNAATPAALASSVAALLDRNGSGASAQRAAFADVRERLGTPGAGQRVADMAARLVA